MNKCKVIAIANQKGGVGKTTTAVNLGAGLVRQGKRVLLVDLDSQGNLSMSLGYHSPDELDITMYELLDATIANKELPEKEKFILKTSPGVDLIPANIQLSAIDTLLVNAMSRETKLKMFLDNFKMDYDYILIDCMPSLGMLTINALVTADSLIIPVQAHFLSAKGLELLLKTIGLVQAQLNPNLKIDGILLTLVDSRTKVAKQIVDVVRDTYGKHINIFETFIPTSVKAAEATPTGKSIFEFDKNNKVAIAYENFTSEVIYND